MPTALRSATRSQFRKSVVVPTIHSRRILPLLEPPRSQVTFCVRGVVSPLLANVYLHYAFDVWVQHWREHRATGDVIIVRYADDIVMGFEQRADAERFLQEWKERLRKFGLELHPDKTRLIEFGRFAAEDRKRRGQGKPETFNFLGCTHICAKNRKTGGFSVDRKTIRKRLSAKLKAVREELRRRWHEPVAEVGKWLRSVVQGYFNYHAVPGNIDSLQSFRAQVVWHWSRALQRRVSAVRAVCSNPARTDLCGGRGVNSRPYRDCGRGQRATAAPMPI